MQESLEHISKLFMLVILKMAVLLIYVQRQQLGSICAWIPCALGARRKVAQGCSVAEVIKVLIETLCKTFWS
jgi:hypothetical protein